MTELRRVVQLAWRRFLASEAGVEGLLFLRERTPIVQRVQQTESHNIIFDAGVVEGYRMAIEALSAIIGKEEEKQIDYENK